MYKQKRSLNSVMKNDTYPLTYIDETFDTGASWFSTLDVRSGNWQVGLEHEDKPKAVFITIKAFYNLVFFPSDCLLDSSGTFV